MGEEQKDGRLVGWLYKNNRRKIGSRIIFEFGHICQKSGKNKKNENFRQKTEVPFYFVRAEVIIFPSMLYLTLNESWKSRFS